MESGLMRTHLRDFVRFFDFESLGSTLVSLGRAGLLSLIALLTAANMGPTLRAQSTNRITKVVDSSRLVALPNHHPLWANEANDAGALPVGQSLDQFTMVLARSAEQEQAFEQLLADQQNPSSPSYHQWLTPTEIGDRFGLSDSDIATFTSWLQSQGLHVNWVSPSRIFIGFGGAAADVGRAFQTEMHAYKVNGEERISVSTDPMIPEALAPAITSIRGLYTIPEKPSYHTEVHQADSPLLTITSGAHFLTPSDFATIYDIPSTYTGSGYTIGIVSWSRTNPADFTEFDSRTGASVAAPTEVIPAAYGGIDPGPAYTTAQSCTNNCVGAQTEATLDVLRSSSVATGAKILLVVSSPSGSNDGLGADAQYIVQTSPSPAQVMSISFGACESSAGSSGVAFWNQLFQQGAAEGISTFVSSGDSGAAGCDIDFVAPPANPAAVSPNYICSSSYATCVGGTEFNDTANASTYWSSTNSSTLGSALSYIPEGGWNESSTTSVAASGGGVSLFNTPTPSWQTGTGVPAARAGRYTPDVSFSAAGHDGYFGCLAAAGGSCSGNPYTFIGFYGTSAAAPAMAAVAAMLDQKGSTAQGSLNPVLYALAASAPASFHDATVASSGVASCSVSTASMCNNSIPLLSGSGAQPGYLVGTGYDEVTGLGSLDIGAFLGNIQTAPILVGVSISPGAVNSGSPTNITITLSSGALTGGAVVTLISSNSTALPMPASETLAAGQTSFSFAAQAGAVSSSTAVTVSATYNGVTKQAIGTVNPVGVNPTFAVTGAAVNFIVGATTGNTATITVTPSAGFTGSVTLTAQLTASPSGAVDPPTVSFGSTSPVSITSASPGTGTMTITTTSSSITACVTANEPRRGIPWYAGGGAALACILLFGIAPQRRKLRALLGALMLLAVLAGSVAACGGSNSNSCSPSTNPGTTLGNYTFTVTGTSGSTVQTGTVSLSLQ
jgi:subtilase family serine protease